MKNIVLLFCFVILAFNSSAQTVTTRFLDKKQNEVPEKKAKYIETITKHEDGKIDTEIKKIKSGKIISRSSFKSVEPFGITNNGGKIIDYDFEMNYKDTICLGDTILINGIFEDNDSLNYKAPKISSGEINFLKFLTANLQYPNIALEHNIQGKVYVRFLINKEGKIENISVVKGTDILLDKEAVRVFRKLKFDSPIIIYGEAKNVCMTIPITFKLMN